MLRAAAGKGSGWLVCVSDSPMILEATVLAPFKGAQRKITTQRPGSWVMSSWGYISLFMIKEMTGLAWLQQCKGLDWFKNQSVLS